MEHFAKRLKYLRIKLGYTYRMLAGVLNVSKSTIYAWEHEQSEPTLSNLLAIAEFFNVTVDSLVGYKRDSSEDEQ